MVVGKGLPAIAIVLVLGGGARTASTFALGLAQIGEFSFIVATTATGLGLLPMEGFQLVVAPALISVALNPILFRALEPLEHRIGGRPALGAKWGR